MEPFRHEENGIITMAIAMESGTYRVHVETDAGESAWVYFTDKEEAKKFANMIVEGKVKLKEHSMKCPIHNSDLQKMHGLGIMNDAMACLFPGCSYEIELDVSTMPESR